MVRNFVVRHVHQHQKSEHFYRLLALFGDQYVCIRHRLLEADSLIDLIDSLTVKRGRVSGSTLRRKALQ